MRDANVTIYNFICTRAIKRAPYNNYNIQEIILKYIPSRVPTAKEIVTIQTLWVNRPKPVGPLGFPLPKLLFPPQAAQTLNTINTLQFSFSLLQYLATISNTHHEIINTFIKLVEAARRAIRNHKAYTRRTS